MTTQDNTNESLNCLKKVVIIGNKKACLVKNEVGFLYKKSNR